MGLTGDDPKRPLDFSVIVVGVLGIGPDIDLGLADVSNIEDVLLFDLVSTLVRNSNTDGPSSRG